MAAREYESDGHKNHAQIHATIRFNPGAATGSPIVVDNTENFQMVKMNGQAGGAILHGLSGCKTDLRGSCVTVAILQANENDTAWERFYFTHLTGGAWDTQFPMDGSQFPTNNSARLRESITHPERAWIVLNAELHTYATMLPLFDEINASYGASNRKISKSHLLIYRSGDPTFAVRFADGAMGEWM